MLRSAILLVALRLRLCVGSLSDVDDTVLLQANVHVNRYEESAGSRHPPGLAEDPCMEELYGCLQSCDTENTAIENEAERGRVCNKACHESVGCTPAEGPGEEKEGGPSLLQVGAQIEDDDDDADDAEAEAGWDQESEMTKCSGLTMPKTNSRSLRMCASLLRKRSQVRSVLEQLLKAKEGKKLSVVHSGGQLNGIAAQLRELPNVDSVLTVEPMASNALFLKNVFKRNEIKNVQVLNSLLSDSPDVRYARYDGKTFTVAKDEGEALIKSTTLDWIYKSHLVKDVDVVYISNKDGLVNEAVKGARELVRSKGPIVVTEVTLPRDRKEIITMLETFKAEGYDSVAVHEPCEGAGCRSIIHVPKGPAGKTGLLQVKLGVKDLTYLTKTNDWDDLKKLA